MSKRALIINPWITDFKLYDEWMHPIGLYFLISLLKHNRWDVEFINCLERDALAKCKRYNTGDFPSKEISRPELYKKIHRKYKRYGISKDLLRKKLNDTAHPDIILVGSGMTYWIEGVVETVKIIQYVFPNTPIIIGGISASLMPEILKKKLPGVTIFSGSLSGHINKLKDSHPLLGNLSLHGWKPTFIDAFKLINNHYHGPVLTSLGCPFHCSYCASSHLQSKFQIRPNTTVINEMKHLIEHSAVTDFAFYDDALLYLSGKNFLPLAKAIAQLDNKLRLHVPNGLHIRWLDAEVLEAMRKCGFITLRFGYESSSRKYLKETNAKTSRTQLCEKLNLIKSAGFKSKDIGIYVMGGLPNQTVEDVLEELSFVASLDVKVKPVFLSPVPHTKLFEHYARTFPQLQKEPLSHNDTFFITQLPGWSYSAIEEIKKKAQEYNYCPNTPLDLKSPIKSSS